MVVALDPPEARRRAEHSQPDNQRRIIVPSRQRVTLRATWRSVPMRFSIALVVAKKRRRRGDRFSLRTVRVSSRPSRRLAAASLCPLSSSHATRRRSCRRAASALAAR